MHMMEYASLIKNYDLLKLFNYIGNIVRILRKGQQIRKQYCPKFSKKKP